MAGMSVSSSSAPQPEPWGRLRPFLLLIWTLGVFGTMYFARDLSMLVAGWPVHLWLASQGLLVFFVLVVAVFAWAANRTPSLDGSDQVS